MYLLWSSAYFPVWKNTIMVMCQVQVNFIFVKCCEFLFHLEGISPVLMVMEPDSAGYSNKIKLWGTTFYFFHPAQTQPQPQSYTKPPKPCGQGKQRPLRWFQGSSKNFYWVSWQSKEQFDSN